MNRNRRSMGTVKTDWKAQRTSSTGFGGPPSTNKKSKLPKPASTSKSSSSRGRSGSMDRPRGSAVSAAFGEFKTPRYFTNLDSCINTGSHVSILVSLILAICLAHSNRARFHYQAYRSFRSDPLCILG